LGYGANKHRRAKVFYIGHLRFGSKGFKGFSIFHITAFTYRAAAMDMKKGKSVSRFQRFLNTMITFPPAETDLREYAIEKNPGNQKHGKTNKTD
jgi:hypothetical protein